MTARIGHRLAICILAVGVAACRRDCAREGVSARLVSDTSAAIVSVTDTEAIAAAVQGVVVGRASRDTDSSGTGIVDGDLRPGTAASNPDSAADARQRATSAPAIIPSPTGIALVEGLRLTSALHFPDGDRENVVTVSEISNDGVLYRWRLEQRSHDGRVQRLSVSRLVSLADLAGAPRLNLVYGTGERTETPGYTAMSMSRSSFARISTAKEIPYAITDLETGLLGERAGALGVTRLAYRGTLTRLSSTPEDMPILLDGVRTHVPSVHVHGHFALQEKSIDADFWILADSTNPLLLRSVMGTDVLQMIRIDRPSGAATTAVESGLTRDCRAEVPGIYFPFASADLALESRPALAGVAAMLARHSDWSMVIEGHTDSVGGTASNQSLSERRAAAVRSALVADFHIDASRLSARGFGAARPRESNATIEGRARNRRVEIVRPCGSGK